MKSLNIELITVPLSDLKPYKNNPRKHSKEKIDLLAKQMKQLGFLIPITIDKNNDVITGHARIEAARQIGMSDIPCILHSHLTAEQRREFRLFDNKIAELSSWDLSRLAVEFEFLLQCDFDLSMTAFSTSEIDFILSQNMEASFNDQDAESTIDLNLPAVTQYGDLWSLGKHKIYCGDALSHESYKVLFNQEKASLIFTDPPYNVRVNGHVCGNGKSKHREFPQASGEMNIEEFIEFLMKFLNNSTKCIGKGSIIYCCMDWRHSYELIVASKKADLEQINLCVWNKNNGGMGSFYRSKHELIYVFKYGKGKHINNINLGKDGRYRTNVWDYPAASKTGDNSDVSIHPTVKPTQMIADAIMDSTHKKDIVLDPFLGSGSTILAAEKTGRYCHGIELDPLYVDVAIRRWQKETGGKALNLNTNKIFDDMEVDHVK